MKKEAKNLIGKYITDGRFDGIVSHVDKDGWTHLTNGTLISPKSINTFKVRKAPC